MTDKQITPHSHQEEIDKAINSLDITIAIGDEFIDDHGRVMVVVGFDYGMTDHKEQPRVNLKAGGFRSTWDVSFDRFMPNSRFRRDYVKLVGGYKQAKENAQKFIDNPMLVDPEPEKLGEGTQETALSNVATEHQIEQIKAKFQIVADRAALVERLMTQKMNKVQQITWKMQDRLSYLNSVLGVINSYMGIYEQIKQIKDGEAAPLETPIHIFQGILWMDEEVGDIEWRTSGQIGIDFESVDVFDEWVTRDNNWKYITPYEKCIVALKPSRQFRDYGDIWANAAAQDKNSAIYLLIRNGQQFYRIFTGLVYGDVLFPTLDTWQSIIKKLDETDYESERLKIKKDELVWRKRVALLQGIFDRTNVLNPTHPDINLFKEEDYEAGRVVLVRDMETLTLPDGKKPYQDWHYELNSQVKRGSRILLARIPRHDDDWGRRFGGNFYNYIPPLPDPGIYKVVEVVQKRLIWTSEPRTFFKILYNPEDEVFTRDKWGRGTYETRKNRISFLVSPSDWFVLYYDHISLEDVEFYIGRRFERRNYQKILPTLYRIYRERKQEAAKEIEFVKYFADMEGFDEVRIWEAVDWWKHKNIWKRPLTEDDKKAWRMIRQYLKKAE